VLTGQLGAAIAAIRRKGTDAERQIDDLLRFAVSDEYAELRRLATA